jgi:hypothetical protein
VLFAGGQRDGWVDHIVRPGRRAKQSNGTSTLAIEYDDLRPASVEDSCEPHLACASPRLRHDAGRHERWSSRGHDAIEESTQALIATIDRYERSSIEGHAHAVGVGSAASTESAQA